MSETNRLDRMDAPSSAGSIMQRVAAVRERIELNALDVESFMIPSNSDDFNEINQFSEKGFSDGG